jgi:acyl carrier protein
MTGRIIAIIERETCREHVTPETRLDSLGMDSLEFMSLITCLRAEVGDIPDEAISYLEQVSDIVKLFEAVKA